MKDDTISRQAAIRWVKTECNPYGNPTLDFESGKKVIAHLEQMPSAQPEIIHCESCGHWKNEHICECLSKYGTFETPKNFYCGYGKEK